MGQGTNSKLKPLPKKSVSDVFVVDIFILLSLYLRAQFFLTGNTNIPTLQIRVA